MFEFSCCKGMAAENPVVALLGKQVVQSGNDRVDLFPEPGRGGAGFLMKHP